MVMDEQRFDALARAVSAGTSRRHVLGVLAGSLGTMLGGGLVPRAQGAPTKGKGNSQNAKSCQKGGWQTQARSETPTVPFTSEEECVSYGAQGGTLVPLVVNPCAGQADGTTCSAGVCCGEQCLAGACCPITTTTGAGSCCANAANCAAACCTGRAAGGCAGCGGGFCCASSDPGGPCSGDPDCGSLEGTGGRCVGGTCCLGTGASCTLTAAQFCCSSQCTGDEVSDLGTCDPVS